MNSSYYTLFTPFIHLHCHTYTYVHPLYMYTHHIYSSSPNTPLNTLYTPYIHLHTPSLHGRYTRTLEAMLRERGVDVGEVESTYFYDAQDLTKPSSKQGREKEMY